MRSAAPLLVIAVLAACTDEPLDTATPPAAASAAPASQPASRPGAGPEQPGEGALPAADPATYLVDGPIVPQRDGVRRIFMRQPKVVTLRDPVFLPGTNDVVFVAKQAGVVGLWRMPADGSKPAEIVVPRPMFDPNGPRTARNRQNWFIGTPRPFPDGKHLIFEGTSPNPFEKYGNTFGIAPIEGGIVKAAVARGVQTARTPDVHSDGETVVFSSCDELRIGRLQGRDDQEFETTRVVHIPKGAKAAPSVCTVHRPRFSPDGKQIVFEGIGRLMTEEFAKANNVPQPVNPGDYVLEPWIVNTDGTGLRRLITDEGYAMIAGRLQSGGSRDPVFSPDGARVAFAHGNAIAVVTVDGKQARIVARAVVASKTGDPLRVFFEEDDPAFSEDGKLIASASRLSVRDLAPPGISIIDLQQIDATPAVPEPMPQPGDALPPPRVPEH